MNLNLNTTSIISTSMGMGKQIGISAAYLEKFCPKTKKTRIDTQQLRTEKK